MFKRDLSHQETLSLVALTCGVAVLLSIAVFLSSPARPATVSYVAPQTQTAFSFGGFISSIVSAVTSVFNVIGNAVNSLLCHNVGVQVQNFSINGCGGGSGNGSGLGGGGGGGPGSGNGPQNKSGGANPAGNGNGPSPSGNAGSQPGAGGGSPSGAGGRVPQTCQSATANSCGMYGSGFLDANGNCPATPPPDSSCPAPKIGSFYANPNRVQKNTASTLYWSVTQATQCAIRGGGLSLSSLGITGQQPTNPITSTTDFTLTCSEGSGPSSSQSTSVGVIPTYQEI